MLLAALGFFFIAVILGLYLLSLVISHQKIPKFAPIIHGLSALIGIIILSLYCFYYNPAPLTSLIFFLFAASGGLLMMYKRKTRKRIPAWLALGHGFIAFIGIAILLVLILV